VNFPTAEEFRQGHEAVEEIDEDNDFWVSCILRYDHGSGQDVYSLMARTGDWRTDVVGDFSSHHKARAAYRRACQWVRAELATWRSVKAKAVAACDHQDAYVYASEGTCQEWYCPNCLGSVRVDSPKPTKGWA
jgi:hypothetical protein